MNRDRLARKLAIVSLFAVIVLGGWVIWQFKKNASWPNTDSMTTDSETR